MEGAIKALVYLLSIVCGISFLVILAMGIMLNVCRKARRKLEADNRALTSELAQARARIKVEGMNDEELLDDVRSALADDE